MELFVDSLLTKTLRITNSRNAKTLSPSHMKQCIMGEQRFDFLRELVKNIPDISVAEESATYYNDEEDDQSSPEMQHSSQTFQTTNSSTIFKSNQSYKEIESIPSTGSGGVSCDWSLPSTSNQAHKHHIDQQEYTVVNNSLTNGGNSSHYRSMDDTQYTTCLTTMQLLNNSSPVREQECLKKNEVINNENPSTKGTVSITRCSDRNKNYNVVDKSLKRRNSNISDNNCAITKSSSSLLSASSTPTLKLKPAPILNVDYSQKPIIKIDYGNIIKTSFNKSDTAISNSDLNSSILKKTKEVPLATSFINLSNEIVCGSIKHTVLPTASEVTVLSSISTPAKDTFQTDETQLNTTNVNANDNKAHHDTKVNLKIELDEDYDDL